MDHDKCLVARRRKAWEPSFKPWFGRRSGTQNLASWGHFELTIVAFSVLFGRFEANLPKEIKPGSIAGAPNVSSYKMKC